LDYDTSQLDTATLILCPETFINMPYSSNQPTVDHVLNSGSSDIVQTFKILKTKTSAYWWPRFWFRDQVAEVLVSRQKGHETKPWSPGLEIKNKTLAITSW